MTLRAAPPRDVQLERRADLLWIQTEYLAPDPDQPRKEFDETTLEELAQSIADIGVLTPLRVRPADVNGMHMLTDGERRFRAGRSVGVVEFPCMVEGADPDHAFFEAYATSLHRDALSHVDAAVGMQRIREAFGLADDEAVAAKLKKSLGWVRQMNAVLGLDQDTRRIIRERGEPVAVAVGLRAQPPADRAPTLDAIATLPSRDAKVEFISRVNEQRRAGAPIDEAIARVRVASASNGTNGSNGTKSRQQPGIERRTIVGRPTHITLPFAWRQIADGWWEVDVHPSVLATTRLASRRTVSLAEWRDALTADLTAFRDASASADDDAKAWASVAEALLALLPTG